MHGLFYRHDNYSRHGCLGVQNQLSIPVSAMVMVWLVTGWMEYYAVHIFRTVCGVHECVHAEGFPFFFSLFFFLERGGLGVASH